MCRIFHFLFLTRIAYLSSSPCIRSLPPPPDYLKRARLFSNEPIGTWDHCLGATDFALAGKWDENWSKILTIWDAKISKSSSVIGGSKSLPPIVSADDLIGTDGTVYRIRRDFGPRKSSHVYIGESSDKKIRVFKFETNCPAIRNNMDCVGCNTIANEEPLLMEFIISEIACGEICPKIFAVSSPEIISENTDPRLQFGVLKPQLNVPLCSRIGSTVRFVEEELVGKSVDTLFNSKMDSINRAILAGKIFIKTIDLLEQLHDNGFVHGDIHVGNIVKRSIESTSDIDLVLIDFGLGKFFPVEIGTEEKLGPHVHYGLSPALLSRYQLEDCRATRRDDVYRSFEVFLTLVTDMEYGKIFGSHGQFAISIKTNPDHFDVVNGFDNYTGIRPVKDALARAGGNTTVLDLWGRIHSYIATQISIDERPTYEWLRETMTITLNELESHASPELQIDEIEIEINTSTSDEDSRIQSGSLI